MRSTQRALSRYGAALLAATALSATPQVVSAQTSWQGGNSFDWSNNTNWTNNAPNGATAAFIAGGGNFDPRLTTNSAALSLGISGGGLVLDSRTLTLTQAFELSGGTVLGPGTMTVGQGMLMTGGTISGGSYSVAGTATLSGGLIHDNASITAANFTISGGVISGSATLVSSGTYSITDVSIGGSLTGSGSVTTKGGVTLSGTNTYSGNTTLDNGTLTIGSNSALGTGTLLMNSSTTLRAGTTVSLSNNIATSVSGPVMIDTNGFAMTLSGTLAVNNAVSKVGSGTLTLSGTNTYSGATSIDVGTLRAGGANRLSANSAHTAASGAILDLNNFNQTVASLAGAGNVTLGSGTLTTGGDNSTTIFSGVISGIGGLTKAGTGTMTLSGANTYSGATTVNAGTLQAGAANALSSSSTHTVGASGTLSLNGNNQTIASLAGAGNVTLGSATLTTGNAAAAAFSGVVSGTGGLTKQGSGTMTLSGANTYSGATAVNAGTVQAGAANAFSSNSAHTLASGAVLDLNSFNQTVGSLAGTGNVALGSATLITGGNNGSSFYSGVISGTGGLTKAGTGTMGVSGLSTYSGTTTVSGGTLQAGASNRFSANSAYVVGVGATLALASNSQTIASLAGAGSVTLGTGTLTTGGNDTSTTFSGVISGLGGLTKAGIGTMTLSGANTYADATTINAGALRAGAANAFSSASAHTIGLGGTLLLNNFNQTIASLAGAGDVNLGTATLTAGGDNTSTTLSGVIAGTGGLTKQGTGTMTLSGANTYSGATSVDAGTLRLGTGASLSSSTALIVNGGTFDLSGNTQTVRVLGGGSGTLALGSGALTFNPGSGSTSFGGAITGTGSLTIANGELNLSGASTYTGGTTVNGRLGLSGSIAGSVTNNGSVYFTSSSAMTVSNAISGSGYVYQYGAGVTTLSGANTYTGSTTVYGNTLRAGAANTFSAGSTHIVNATKTLALNDFNQTIGALSGAGNVTLGSATLTTGGTNNSTIYSGVVSGTGGLTKAGTGTMALSGANTYSGATNVNAGTLQAGAVNALSANSALTVASDAILDLIGNSQTVAALAGAGNVMLGAGTLTVGSGSNNIASTFSGVISGAGGLTKNGGNGDLTLTGANTYSGGTTVSQGKLIGTTTSLQGNIVNTSALAFDQNTNGTYAGIISGTTSYLLKEGTGTVTLTGANTYSGGATIISDGILQIGAGGTTGSIVSDVTNNATLAFNRSDDITFAGLISGTGALDKLGSNKLILTANNTYTGVTTIVGGTLQLGNGGTTGMIAGDVVNNGTLAFNRSDNVTYAGDISGTGNIAYLGSGTVTLTGTNSYTGDTILGGSTVLAISSDAALGAAGNGVTFAGGTLQAAADFSSSRAFSLITGGGTVDTNGNNVTLSGVVSGAGGLTKSGTGTLQLTGANTYSGGTTVSGGTLSGTTTSLQGDIVNNAAVTFDQATSGTYAGTMSGTGSLTKVGTGNLTLSGANTYTGGTTVSGGTLSGTTSSLQGNIANNAAVAFDQSTDGTYAGAMSGTGSLTKTGTGTVTLTGSNTYSGGTTVSAGILEGTVNSLQGNIVNNANVTFNQSIGGMYTGVMSGTGTLTKTGTGTVALTGLNTYTGGTTVSGGTLQGAAGAIQGDIVNNATVFFGQNVDGTYAGNMSGTGAVTKSGVGVLTFTGTNSYSGTTTVLASGGTLRAGAANTFSAGSAYTMSSGTSLDLNGFDQTIGSLAGGGGLTLGSATLTTGGDNASTTYSGNIYGTGELAKQGTGTMTLTGSNLYSGGTAINGGTIAVGGNGNLGNTSGGLSFNAGTLQYIAAFNSARGITLNSGGGTFNTNGFDATLSGNIGGSGGLTKAGLGTLTLGGTLTYTGGTTVTGGVLKLDSGVALPTTGALVLSGGTLETTGNATVPDLSGNSGTVEVGTGTLTVNQNTNTTYGGTLTGTGGVDKTGTGTLILSGTNTYTGATSVTDGRLAVNGSITSDVTVGSGGNLGGSGLITGNVVTNGTVAPGNSIGTLNITGTFTQAGGSIYQVEVNAQGQSDLINVTGNAVIQANSTVQVIAEQGNYARNTTYTILTTTTGVSGTYANVTSNFAFLRPSLSYDANNVYLTLFQSSNAFASGAQTPNQLAVGTALDLASPTATGDFATVIGALAVLSTQQGPAALTAISGQNYAGFSSAVVAGAQLFMSNFANQAGGANRKGSGTGNRVALAEACDVACETAVAATWGVWGGAVGGAGTLGGNANAGTTTYNLGGFVAGLDRAVDPDFRVGVTVGYTSGRQWTSGFASTGYADTVQVGLYSTFMRDAFYVDGLVGYAYSDNRMQRQIAIPGLAMRVANGSTGVNQFFGQVETGLRFDIGGAPEAYVTPFVRLQGSTATQAAFTENGANSLSLNVAAQTTNSLRTVLGAQLGGAMDLGWREKLSAQLKLGWAHEFANTDRPVTASFAGAPAFPFTTYGAVPQRDGVVLGLNAGTAIAERTSVYLRYEGEFSGLDNAQALSLGVRMTW